MDLKLQLIKIDITIPYCIDTLLPRKMLYSIDGIPLLQYRKIECEKYLTDCISSINLMDYNDIITSDTNNEDYSLFELLLHKIKTCPTINSLYLRGKDIGSDGIIKILNILIDCDISLSPAYNLKTISLIDCNIGTLGAIALAKILIIDNLSIERLIVKNDSIQYDGIVALGNAIASSTTLIELVLNKTIDGSINYLVNSLIYCNTLQILDLSNNCMNNSTFIILNELLKTNNSILFLSISNVIKINDYIEQNEGFRQMWNDSLVENTILKSIDISHNCLQSDDIMVIVHAMKNNKSIQSIYLHNNFITNRGGLLLLDMVKNTGKLHFNHNSILEKLSLYNNWLDYEIEYEIMTLL